ncbi:MAG TPA: tRNA (adenosine(37)-N6)-threonylcarbamoyltransferase complex dimerization subunit type 1 TsaB [Candidatus Kapabacteria bacterium]|nr:tRNA (adenosine(37)-N6)-threonylcarbamoyltransferase complex dimerization subunit type 1 TsaB [Candidatus Kapabacteria bacterium]
MILAFDTSGKDLHLGLFSIEGMSIGEFHHIAQPTERGVHDLLLAQKTKDLLDSNSISVAEISRIGFINGPGSFTGLRIGLAFAKGMAFGSKSTLVPIILHRLLQEQVVRLYPDQTFEAIVTPGYEPSSVYYAPFDSPEEIILRPVAEIIDSLGIYQICGDPILQERFEAGAVQYKPVLFDLSMLAQMTASSTPLDSISTLEPFYGSDFKVILKK